VADAVLDISCVAVAVRESCCDFDVVNETLCVFADAQDMR